jgi:hypothetical protein
MPLLGEGALDGLSDEALRLRHFAQEIARRKRARKGADAPISIKSVRGDPLSMSILEKNVPWRDVSAKSSVPGMLTAEERSYYRYIGAFFSGAGEVVELGPWLGQSTCQLVQGLNENPKFAGRKVHVYDDFVWRDGWMRKWLQGTDIAPPENHASFMPLFEAQTRSFADKIQASRGKLSDYDGNELLDPVRWDGGPIEMIFVDCGRTLEVNEAWWKIFSGHFIRDRTIIVMQDWQNFKRVPELFWENTKLFSERKTQEMKLVHEICDGAIGTFLYTGE